MKRRELNHDPAELPADVAAGPDAWPALADWIAAGRAWSLAAGHERDGWRALLEPDVRYWTTALGGAHDRSLNQASGTRRTEPKGKQK